MCEHSAFHCAVSHRMKRVERVLYNRPEEKRGPLPLPPTQSAAQGAQSAQSGAQSRVGEGGAQSTTTAAPRLRVNLVERSARVVAIAIAVSVAIHCSHFPSFLLSYYFAISQSRNLAHAISPTVGRKHSSSTMGPPFLDFFQFYIQFLLYIKKISYYM